MIWRRPPCCQGATACAEVQECEDGSVQMRHSGDPETVLTFTPEEWTAFCQGVSAGEFNGLL